MYKRQVQIAADGGGVLVELIGHGLKILLSLGSRGVGAVLDDREGIVDGLSVADASGNHVIELVGKVLHLAEEAGEAVGKLLKMCIRDSHGPFRSVHRTHLYPGRPGRGGPAAGGGHLLPGRLVDGTPGGDAQHWGCLLYTSRCV